MSAHKHNECAGPHCSNAAPKNKKLCRPCRAHKEAKDTRERFYSGLAVSASQRADIQQRDEQDACFEAYKWALRDGIGQDTAMDIAELAGEEVENWYRREKQAGTLDARNRALNRISGSDSDRREGQHTAAAMIARAGQAIMGGPDEPE